MLCAGDRCVWGALRGALSCQVSSLHTTHYWSDYTLYTLLEGLYTLSVLEWIYTLLTLLE